MADEISDQGSLDRITAHLDSYGLDVNMELFIQFLGQLHLEFAEFNQEIQELLDNPIPVNS